MRSSYWYGPLTRTGLAAALAAAALDQASKIFLLKVFDLAARGPVRLGPFVDLVLVRNTGNSYGLFQTQGVAGQIVLLTIKAVAVVVLWVWLARARDRLTAVALGLIVGGALGNAVDRLAYGWVADFVYFHISTASWRFSWYVFNLADVAIVAGVLGLLYHSIRGGEHAAKAP